MSRFEHDLRRSLQRREPPAGFAEKVLSRTRDIDKRRSGFFSFARTWRWAIIAAAVVFLAGGAALYQERRHHIQAEQSKQELMQALRITGSRLQLVQERLSEIERKEIVVPLQQ